MIPTRTEKLRFIVEEMHIALHLTMQIADPFVSRTIARHVLIRAKSFIDIIRSLRKPLKSAAHDTQELHRTKEAYADAFAEYFQLSRDRLGAHVQDFDFGKRIELWNDIEFSKISFFVEGARQIYESLITFNLPGYIPYTEPPELTDPNVLKQLQHYQRNIEEHSGIELGSDSLALTRNNTSASLNMTPVHARAGQLALIRRWIALEQDLQRIFSSFPRIARIIKARLVTDLVSFCDCLVTRQVQSGAAQEMDGLDRLVVAAGESAAPIIDFVTASNFDTEPQLTRAVRDSIGAHVETSDTVSISSILSNLDAYDLDRGLNFYERMVGTFIKTCHTVSFLRMYAADGVRIYGVSAGSAQAVSYIGEAPTSQHPSSQPSIDDEDAYGQHLLRWFRGRDSEKGDARQFFQRAFTGSAVVEIIVEADHFDQGYSQFSHEFRRAHQFLVTTLAGGVSEPEFLSILELIRACAGLTPYQLVEALVRYGRDSPHVSQLRLWLICHVLGEIASAPHASVREFLENQSRHHIWEIALEAVLARFKTYVLSEGVFRINHRGATRIDYDEFVGSLTVEMSETEKSITLLAFASAFFSQRIGSCLRPFTSNYADLQSQIGTRCSLFIVGDAENLAILKTLIAAHDYVGVCTLMAISLTASSHQFLREALLTGCCNGTITPATHDQASRNLASCFLLRNNFRAAFEIISNLASRNPEQVDLQIQAVEILTQIPDEQHEISRRIASVRQAYKLTTSDEQRLVDIETEIARRAD